MLTPPPMRREVEATIDGLAAAEDFSGVPRVGHDDGVLSERDDGLACRAEDIPNSMDTRFATSSGSTAVTAMVAMSSSKRACSSWRRQPDPCSAGS